MSRRPFRREKKLVWLFAGLGAIATLSVAALSDGVSDVRMAASANFRELISERSPGKRTGAELSKSKRALNHERAPRSMVMPRTRRKPAINAPNNSTTSTALRAGAPLAIESPELAAALVAPVVVGIPGAEVQFLGVPISSGGGGVDSVLAAPGGGGAVGGGVSPPGGSVGGVPPPAGSAPTDRVTPPVVVTAVPEPQTWATMIIGFGVIGWSLRRRKRVTSRLHNGPKLENA